MARSGSYDFNVTRDDVIKGAIRIVIGRGGKPSEAKSPQTEFDEASQALGMMIKAWQAKGVGLWKNAELIVFPAYNTRSYSLGASGDHATHTLVETEISTAGSTNDTTLTVDSITGISDADNIGIELDDDTLQWTTVNGAPSGSTITITTGITDDVAVDNNVYTYTTKSQRPLTISEGRLHRDDGTETPLEILTREQYMNLSNKTTTGVPNQAYYDPQLDSGVLYVWPVPIYVYDYFKFTARMPIQDMDAATNDFDFPQEWFEALKFNLADRIAPEYVGIDANGLLWIQSRAERFYEDLEMFDAEHGSVYIEADETDVMDYD